MMYAPQVCPNENCMGFGDDTPAEYGRCFLCNTLQVPYSQLPYNKLDPFVRRCLEHYYNLYSSE